MKRTFLASLLISTALLGTGCMNSAYDTGMDEIISTNRAAANNLIRMAGDEIAPGANIIAASFASIDDLTQSSSFGRVASQQLVSQLTAAGFSVKEMLLRNNVYISQEEGEFLLSRAVSDISSQHDAQVVLVGTYAVGDSNVFVTAKLIRTTAFPIRETCAPCCATGNEPASGLTLLENPDVVMQDLVVGCHAKRDFRLRVHVVWIRGGIVVDRFGHQTRAGRQQQTLAQRIIHLPVEIVVRHIDQELHRAIRQLG
jgi:TolB-like protein